MTEYEYTELEKISRAMDRIRETAGTYIVGNEDLIDIIITGLLCEGHVLIEGVPGTAKTVLVKIISLLLGCRNRRVQCAVDTQPSDILGIRIWNEKNHDFELKHGPLFTNILLIDEMNRLPPRSQSAFIEAMSEKQATIDGITIPISPPFFTIATQNPFEQEGTFPLIEAQRDRFMFSVQSRLPAADSELEIIRREQEGLLDWEMFEKNTAPLSSPEEIREFIHIVRRVHVETTVQKYIRDIVMATREHPEIRLGASSRGSIAIIRGAKSRAAMDGRDYVIPDDVKAVAVSALQHRIILNYETQIGGVRAGEIIGRILDTVEVP